MRKYSSLFVFMTVVSSTCLVVANILAVKQFNINFHYFVMPSTAGLLVFPISYIINDCISEVWGYKAARTTTIFAFIANAFACLAFGLSVALPPAEHWVAFQEGYNHTLAQTPRITIASALAFVAGSLVNARIMSVMKIAQQGKRFWQRALVSTVAGELVDTFLFTTLAFAGIIPFTVVLKIILLETVAKTCYETLILPLTSRIVQRVKKVEQIDVYDNKPI